MFTASYPQDTGRVDELKVTDGKAVLVATLGSRGLPTEDRIRAAVDAAEAERSEFSHREEPFPELSPHTPVSGYYWPRRTDLADNIVSLYCVRHPLPILVVSILSPL